MAALPCDPRRPRPAREGGFAPAGRWLVLGLAPWLVLCAAGAWLVPAAPALAQDTEAGYREAAATFHRLRSEGDAEAVHWRDLSDRFRAIHRALPASRRGADALYSAALADREAQLVSGDWRDLSRAVGAFREYVQSYPKDRLADDSLMHLADLLARGYQDLPEAERTYRALMARYPDGDQFPVAEKRLATLTARMAAAEREERSRQPAAPEPAVGLAAGLVTTGPVPGTAGAAGDPTPGGGALRRVQHWSALEWTRVILTTDPGTAYNYRRLEPGEGRPARLYFDLIGPGQPAALEPVIAVNDALLEQIRISRFDKATTRIVLDLKRIERFEVKEFLLPNERKIVVDLHRPASLLASRKTPAEPAIARPGQMLGQGRAAVAQGGAAPVPAVNPLAPQPQLTLKSALGLKVRSIMLDPGHGGHDPGAVGFGVQEKEVALRIALRLRALLAERHPDLRVGMTRETDAFIPLQERPLKAKAFGADLFVSIHLNANEIERFHGVETYFLNLTRDSGALQVAARENATTEKHVSDLNEILVDLLRDTTIVESSELAKVLQTSLVGTLHGRHPRVRDLGVKQAPFLVLMGAEMPGVLVEVGFVTNRGENRRLQDDAYLNRIADGIYEGLRRYIERQNIVASREHTTPLARGDNL